MFKARIRIRFSFRSRFSGRTRNRVRVMGWNTVLS
jgi:hypothetical protein